ncbi:hypothetical protein [Winogradskyella sp.]|uniref:hypothetical protein n=1 Tax=Winogradskyella sp. TaxID=1883156 RepID=UPI002607867E|nr:hypothetical protein [Winogradskyella sp.]
MNKKRWINTFKFTAAYLVAAWTFLQFVDWVLNRYNISPYWVDLLLWIFIGIIPSLLIYFYHRERINQRKLHRREKIIFPLNILLIMVVTYFGFGNSDLGATTKDINYTDDEGIAQSKTITKEEFRIGVPIFEFDNLTNNDSIDWWSPGIAKLLEYDLKQNKSLSPLYLPYSETADKIRQASLFYDFYIDGAFKKEGETTVIEVCKRQASNAKVLESQRFEGNDFLSLLDQISIFITEKAGFLETNTIKYLDLPINSFMSNSEEAIKQFLDLKYEAAIDLDSTFAMAYLEKSKHSRIYGQSNAYTRELTEKGLKYRQKLPLQKQLEVAIEHSLAYGNKETAEQQVNLQLEVDPNNFDYNLILYSIYCENKELDKFLQHSENRFNKDPSLANASSLLTALLGNKKEKKLLNLLEKYEIINPDIRIYKMTPLLFQGKIDEAETLLKDVKMTFPQVENTLKPFETIINYQKTVKPSPDKLRQFIGQYRSENNEQTFTYWLNDDRIMRWAKNQYAIPFLLAGENTLAGGIIGSQSAIDKLIKDEEGQAIGVLISQSDNNETLHLWYWREDDSILKAHEAFDNGDLEKTLELYQIAYKKNAEHKYLESIIEHLNYIKSKDREELLAQHRFYEGSYGPRKFFLKNDKFYYYREGTEQSKVELLPISENRYMTRAGYRVQWSFENDPSGKMASVSHRFEVGEDLKFEWLSDGSNDPNNYFLKDD